MTRVQAMERVPPTRKHDVWFYATDETGWCGPLREHREDAEHDAEHHALAARVDAEA